MKRMCSMCREVKEESEYIEKGKEQMIKCPDCNKFGSCEKASEDVIECLDFKKRSYDTKLVKVDRLNYKFEEVK